MLPTTHFHSRQLLLIAHESAIRAREDATAPLGMTNHAVPAIILAAAATEAFVNEFADFAPEAYSNSLGMEKIPPPVSDCVRILRELERAREQVTTKYFEAATALGKPFNKGSAPFQDFKLLTDLRNAIIHIKPTTEGDRPPGERVTDDLAQRKLALPNTGAGSFPWFDRIMTKEAAQWAHNSVLAIIRGFLDRVPVPPDYDPLEYYRIPFRFHQPI